MPSQMNPLPDYIMKAQTSNVNLSTNMIQLSMMTYGMHNVQITQNY